MNLPSSSSLPRKIHANGPDGWPGRLMLPGQREPLLSSPGWRRPDPGMNYSFY